jgi:hypothetical protein
VREMCRPNLRRLNNPEHRRIMNERGQNDLIRFFERIKEYMSTAGVWAPIPPREASDAELLRRARLLRTRQVQLPFPMDPDLAADIIEEGVRKRLVVKETVEDTKRDWAQHAEFQEAEEREENDRDLGVFHEVKRQAREQGPDSLAAAQLRELQRARRDAQGSRGRRK